MNEPISNRPECSPEEYYAGPRSILPHDHFQGSAHSPAPHHSFPNPQSNPHPPENHGVYLVRSQHRPQFCDDVSAYYASRYIESHWSGRKSHYYLSPSVPQLPTAYPSRQNTGNIADAGWYADRGKQASHQDNDISSRSQFYPFDAARESWWGLSHNSPTFPERMLEKPKHARSSSSYLKSHFDSQDFAALPPPAYPFRWQESIEKEREDGGSRGTLDPVNSAGKSVEQNGAAEATKHNTHPRQPWFNANESLQRYPSPSYPGPQFRPLINRHRMSSYDEPRPHSSYPPSSWREDGWQTRSIAYRSFEDDRRYGEALDTRRQSYIPPHHYHPCESRRLAGTEIYPIATQLEPDHAHGFHQNPYVNPQHHHHHRHRHHHHHPDWQSFYSDQPHPFPAHAQLSIYHAENGSSSRTDSLSVNHHRPHITDSPSMHPPGDEVGLGPDIDTFDPGPKSSESSSNVSGNAKTKLVYELIVRQQPSRARMIGFGEKDRRPIDPPPIVQLRIFNENGDSLDFGSAPFLVMHASIWSADGQTSRSIVINPFAQSNQALSPTALPPGLVFLPSSAIQPEGSLGDNDLPSSSLKRTRKRQQEDEVDHVQERSQNKRDRTSVELISQGISFTQQHLSNPRHNVLQYHEQHSNNPSSITSQLPVRDVSNRSPSDDTPPSVGSSENDKAPRESGHGSGSDESTLLNGEGSRKSSQGDGSMVDSNPPDLRGETGSTSSGGCADDIRGRSGSGKGLNRVMMVIAESEEGSSENTGSAAAAKRIEAHQGQTDSDRRKASGHTIRGSENFFDNPPRRNHHVKHSRGGAPIPIHAVDNERDGNMEDDESEDRPLTAARRHLIRKRLHQRIYEVQKVSSYGRSGISSASTSDLSVRNDDEETIVDGHLGSSMFNDPHLSATSMQGQHHEHQVQSGHAPQKSLSVSLGSNPPVALAQVLVGSLVSPCHVLADVDGTKGMFFVFSDISVRVGGKYRLKFLLYDVKPGDMSRFKASVMTDIFTVYHPKEFPGMADSTPLSKCLAKQGVRIHIRSHAEI